MVKYSMVWYGMVWYAMVWFGVVWCMWCGVVWCSACGVVCCGACGVVHVVWCGVVLCGVVWCGVADQLRHDSLQLSLILSGNYLSTKIFTHKLGRFKQQKHYELPNIKTLDDFVFLKIVLCSKFQILKMSLFSTVTFLASRLTTNRRTFYIPSPKHIKLTERFIL